MNQNDAQPKFTLGREVNISRNSRNSLFFEFAYDVNPPKYNPYTVSAVKYNYFWGKGYR